MTSQEQDILTRVARAMCEADGMNPNNWRHKVKAARAAIEAMMEPTEAMVDAGLLSLADSTGEPGAHIARDPLFAWRAMVAASLSKGGE